MAVPEGGRRRGGKPVFLVWYHPEGKPVEDSVQLDEVFASLEEAMKGATIHAANGREAFSMEFAFHSDEVSDFYWGETEDGTMYTIHGVTPRGPLH